MTNSKRNEAISHSQIIQKPKSNFKEEFNGDSLKAHKHNFTKLKFIYYNSTKKL